MNKKKLEVLAGHIRDGIKVASAAASAVSDVGERNIDRVVLYFKRTRESSIEASGIDYYKVGFHYVINTDFGEADSNAEGVRVLNKYLNDRGCHNAIWRRPSDSL